MGVLTITPEISKDPIQIPTETVSNILKNNNLKSIKTGTVTTKLIQANSLDVNRDDMESLVNVILDYILKNTDAQYDIALNESVVVSGKNDSKNNMFIFNVTTYKATMK